MHLLRLELYKIVPYRTFWAILGIFMLLVFLIFYSVHDITINNTKLGSANYQFPEIWLKLTYVSSFFNTLLGILVIVLVSDEFTFRTFRQQLIDGLSRLELVLAKFYVILGLAAICTVFLLLLGLFFGLRHSLDTSMGAIAKHADALFYYFLQAVGFMSLAMLIGFFIKKSGLAIIAFISFVLVLEPIIRSQIPDRIDKFFPTKVLHSLTPMPVQQLFDQATSPTELLTPGWAVLPALLYIGLFLAGSYLLLKLRDM
ncbi:ABC transporter permease subunit [Pontibacter qinzhouensis]|uniref:ABC transporter permease subunit n=1 Tax=Pontibacter qinzhouensis TaxID=2603253 RepID=A0A5C8JHT3_9BACT|nr:ABC transporter permease [Pontibacter qinzhouensis]TXK37880.1 ABC transporter permease subunit [Pontibacter qinzhouensis]